MVGRCYNLKISPTISLESQSSQPGAIATAAKLTLPRKVRFSTNPGCRFIDWAFPTLC